MRRGQLHRRALASAPLLTCLLSCCQQSGVAASALLCACEDTQEAGGSGRHAAAAQMARHAEQNQSGVPPVACRNLYHCYFRLSLMLMQKEQHTMQRVLQTT